MERYDLVFIGAGPAGYVGAIRAAQLGARVAVIEKDEVGGACLQRGCIPTKTLVASAAALRTCREAAAFGLILPEPARPDLAAMLARKDKVVSILTKGILNLFKSNKIVLLRGQGKLLAPDRVEVKRADQSELTLQAKGIILAPGSRSKTLPALPINGSNILTSDHLLNLSEIPARVLVVGAGAIGCEWAFILKELGSEVTVVEMLPRPVPYEDEDISELLAREMRKAKIRLSCGDRILSIGEDNLDGKLVARMETGLEVRVDKVLVSVGRAFNTEGLGLEELGIKLNSDGSIVVNEKMETNVPGIYAAGDATGGILLAHKASAEAVAAATNALGGEARIDYSVIPSATFTFPEIGSVGLREHEVKQKGIPYRVGKFPFRGLGKAQALGEIAGEVKVIVQAETDRLLGVHIIGPAATELIHEAALALRHGLTALDLAGLIHAHPTLSEALMEAAAATTGQAIHLPRQKSE
jgi:dihydrolipoamide dehydrogenase